MIRKLAHSDVHSASRRRGAATVPTRESIRSNLRNRLRFGAAKPHHLELQHCDRAANLHLLLDATLDQPPVHWIARGETDRHTKLHHEPVDWVIRMQALMEED